MSKHSQMVFNHLQMPQGTIEIFGTLYRQFCTSAVAEALQLSLHGKTTLVVQFLKGGISQGVDHPTKLGENLTWLRPAIGRCIDSPQATDTELEAVRELWRFVQTHCDQYDCIILDEIGLAVDWGYVPEVELIEFLTNKPSGTDVILVGMNIPQSADSLADQVTVLRSREAQERVQVQAVTAKQPAAQTVSAIAY